jgi:2-polyprenyl-3-methyl-5-hydroxy-6-metoxy-1,4-benzoquinol methylase
MNRPEPNKTSVEHRLLGRFRTPGVVGTGCANVRESASTEPDSIGPSQPTVISSLAEFEAKLSEIETAIAISDDAMRQVFQSFIMSRPSDIPADPYSQEYRDRQHEFYRFVSGRDRYEVENEHSNFRVDANRPFPYYTESAETVGAQIMAFGFIIKSMGLPAGSSVLELGPGWGNTTIELARMGYEVTAVDIDATFVDLIKERADKFSLCVDARRGEFLDVDQFSRTFDAVLFFESFHHCANHRELIRRLGDVVKVGGKIFFAAEPIADSFPMPWGVRTDGEALWAMRRFGWLELGYQESYFLRMLGHLGWIATKHVTDATHLGLIFEARRANGIYELSTFELPPDEDATWVAPDGAGVPTRYSTNRSLISLEQGRASTTIEIEAINRCPIPLRYRVEHGCEETTGSAPPNQEFVIRLPYDDTAAALVIEATEWRPADVMDTIDRRLLGLAIRSITLH